MVKWQNPLFDPMPRLKSTFLFFPSRPRARDVTSTCASHVASEGPFFLWINCAACTHVTSQWLRTEQDCLLRCVSEILQHGLFCRKHLFSRCRLTDKLRRSLFWVITVWLRASHFLSLLNLTKTHQCYAYSLWFFPSRKVSWVCLEEMRSNYRYGNARLSCETRASSFSPEQHALPLKAQKLQKALLYAVIVVR